MGRPCSEETKRKISEHHKRHGIKPPGRTVFGPLTEEHKKKISTALKGEKAYWYGRKHSVETKKKLSLAHTGRTPWNKGLGTISSENEKARKTKQARMWRIAVFERDNYTCQFCGERGGKLHADHIKRFADYPELRYELTNGRTLCFDCHKTTDTYGWTGKSAAQNFQTSDIANLPGWDYDTLKKVIQN